MTCAYCHGEIEVPQGAVECPSCSTAVHKDCRYKFSDCPSLGCSVQHFRPLADGNAWERARSGADRFERLLGGGISAVIGTVLALGLGYGIAGPSGAEGDEIVAVPPRIYVRVEAKPEPYLHHHDRKGCTLGTAPTILVEEDDVAAPLEPSLTTQQLCNRLADGSTRDAASDELIRRGPGAARAVSWTLEIGGSLLQRREAAYVLQEIASEHDLSGLVPTMTLARAIAEGDDVVGDCCRNVLADLGDLGVAELVIAASSEALATHRIAAARALVGLDETLPTGFVSVLSDPDSSVRAQGLAVYRLVPTLLPAARTALDAVRLNDPVPEVRAMAALVLASKTGRDLDPERKHAIAWQLTQPQNDVNTLRLCREYLSKYLPQPALDAFYEGLGAEKDERRIHAVESLGALAQELAIELKGRVQERLCERLEAVARDDPEHRVRTRALSAVIKARSTTITCTENRTIVCGGGIPEPSMKEIGAWESKGLSEWVRIVRNPRTQPAHREHAVKAIVWRSHETLNENLEDLGLIVLDLAPGVIDGVMLSSGTSSKTPYYLRGLQAFDIVVRVDVGTELHVPKSPEELGVALSDLRENRRSGTWLGGVTVIRNGKQILIGSGRF